MKKLVGYFRMSALVVLFGFEALYAPTPLLPGTFAEADQDIVILSSFVSDVSEENPFVLGNFYALMVNTVSVLDGNLPPGLVQVLAERGYSREDMLTVQNNLFSAGGDRLAQDLGLSVESFVGTSVPLGEKLQAVLREFIALKSMDSSMFEDERVQVSINSVPADVSRSSVQLRKAGFWTNFRMFYENIRQQQSSLNSAPDIQALQNEAKQIRSQLATPEVQLMTAIFGESREAGEHTKQRERLNKIKKQLLKAAEENTISASDPSKAAGSRAK